MANLKQIRYMINGSHDDDTGFTPGHFFDENLFNGKQISKLSIQAPESTVVLINGREILIGGSNIYDFTAENVIITSLIFPSQEASDDTKLKRLQELLQTQIANIIDDISPVETADPDSVSEQTKDIFKTACNTLISIDASNAQGYLTEVTKSSHGNPDSLQDVIVNYIQIQEANN